MIGEVVSLNENMIVVKGKNRGECFNLENLNGKIQNIRSMMLQRR